MSYAEGSLDASNAINTSSGVSESFYYLRSIKTCSYLGLSLSALAKFSYMINLALAL